jgi:hypothetical protein
LSAGHRRWTAAPSSMSRIHDVGELQALVTRNGLIGTALV